MTLYAHQQRALAHTEQHDRCALWMGCGTGKTLVAIEAIKRAWMPALIVAPKRVIDHTWPSELAKWWPDCDWVSLATTPAKRDEILRQPPPEVTLVNYELIPKLCKWQWPMVVLDESTRIKNRASQTFKALRSVSKRIDRIIELTGTPLPNGLMDLWSQLYLLDGGERLGRTITAYRERYFTRDYSGFSYTPTKTAQRDVESLCRDICLTMRTEDYIDLPALTVLDVEVDLPASARKVYDSMRKELVAEICGAPVSAVSAASMADKLLQITSGTVYGEDGTPHALHTAKLDALDDIIAGGEPVLIVYRYRSELEALRQRYPHLVELRDSKDTVDRWTAGGIALFAIHPASAGHGINLQHGGRIAVWMSPTYNLEHYEQANARLYRNGQTRPVTIYRLLATASIDARVVSVLSGKSDTQSALLEALK